MMQTDFLLLISRRFYLYTKLLQMVPQFLRDHSHIMYQYDFLLNSCWKKGGTQLASTYFVEHTGILHA